MARGTRIKKAPQPKTTAEKSQVEVETSEAESEIEVTEAEDVVDKKEEKERKTVSEKVIPKKKRDAEDWIPCKSICVGRTFFIGPKSEAPYEFGYKGEVVDVEYRDIVAAIHHNSSIFFKPFIMIEDQDVVDEFPKLKKLYESLYDVGEIEDIFKLRPTQMLKKLKELPAGYVDSVKNTAATMIADGSLDSVKTIQALDDFFGTKLMLMTGLFDDLKDDED